jgi:hypothetical protein
VPIADPSSSASGVAWWLQFSFAVPVAATVLGWIVLARQNDLRVRRQEIRELIEELRTRCDRAVDAADIYWNTSAKAAERASAAIKLKAAFPGIIRIITSARAAGLAFEAWDLVVEMRQAATGGNFDEKGRRPRAADRERILDISLAAEEVIAAVDAVYFQQFPTRRTRSWLVFLPAIAALGLSRDTRS